MSNAMKVEAGLSPDVLARVEAMRKEDASITIEHEKKPVEKQVVEINLDKPKKGGTDVPAAVDGDSRTEDSSQHADAEQKDAESPDDLGDDDAHADVSTGDQAPVLQLIKDIDESLKLTKVDRAALIDKLLEDHKLTVRVKGKDRKISYHDIKSMIGREDTFQKKYDAIMGGEEGKLLAAFKAAKDGDKAAVKKLHGMLIQVAKAEDGDRLLLDMEDVKDDFDAEKAQKQQSEKDAWDEAFADVKDSVDFKDTMATIETDLKARLPSKVYTTYWNDPKARRSMFDLVRSGRAEELLDAFDQELETLPLAKQMEIENDPDAWGNLFIKVIRQTNGKRAKSGKVVGPKADQSSDDAGLRSVSSGAKGRRASTVAATDPNAPDFMKMSSEDFSKFQRENGLL